MNSMFLMHSSRSAESGLMISITPRSYVKRGTRLSPRSSSRRSYVSHVACLGTTR